MAASAAGSAGTRDSAASAGAASAAAERGAAFRGPPEGRRGGMMKVEQAMEQPALRRLVQGLIEALGPRLRSVVLYGSAARGDFHEGTSDLNVLLVLEDLDPATLETLSPSVARWCAKGHHAPRLFSPALIAESADVFPIEFLD